MNFAQDKKGSSRTVGFGAVVLIHIIIIWGLASGLARKITQKLTEDVQVKVVEEVKKPPEEIKKVEPPPPKLETPPPPYVPPPEVVITAPAPPAMERTAAKPPPVMTHVTAPAPPAPAPRKGPTQAAEVCTKMGKPELPAVNWSGEAIYKVTATVKAGRVVAMEIASLRSGVDRRAARALESAIKETLTDTYECPGDHVFEQEFDFKIDD